MRGEENLVVLFCPLSDNNLEHMESELPHHSSCAHQIRGKSALLCWQAPFHMYPLWEHEGLEEGSLF